MTDDLPLLPLETPRGDPTLGVFIPEDRAAVCGDCGGVFILEAGACSGCGSRHWSLFKRAPVPAAEVTPEPQAVTERQIKRAKRLKGERHE